MNANKEIFEFKKNILIIGKSEIKRHKLMNKIISNSNLEIIKFPKAMKSVSEYFETIQKKHLFKSYYQINGKYNSNQVFDFHIDWIAENKVLLVFEDFHEMENAWKLEILKMIFNNLEQNKKTGARLLFSMDEEKGIFDKLSEIIDENEYKTSNQIIESNLEIFEL